MAIVAMVASRRDRVGREREGGAETSTMIAYALYSIVLTPITMTECHDCLRVVLDHRGSQQYHDNESVESAKPTVDCWRSPGHFGPRLLHQKARHGY